VTYNVQTLKGVDMRKVLNSNFKSLNVSIGCFQETRAERPLNRVIGGLLVCASAAEKGVGGCEIWIDLSTPFFKRNGQKFCISRDGVTVVYATFRVLIVRCVSRNIDFYIISAMPRTPRVVPIPRS